jgi:hypothetical protein
VRRRRPSGVLNGSMNFVFYDTETTGTDTTFEHLAERTIGSLGHSVDSAVGALLLLHGMIRR